MERFARLPVGFRRGVYRVGYAVLCVYWFVCRPSTDGVKCVLTDGDRLLLVRHTYGRPDWELPGGSLKSGEDPIVAARREMGEELGVLIDNWNEFGEIHGRAQHRRDTVYCFQAEIHEPALALDLGELYEARWFPRSNLPNNLGRYTRPVVGSLTRLDAERA